MKPFIIYALPRSRTFWLAKFLTYGDYECSHEQTRHLRGMDDVRSWLAQDYVGSAETAASRWWRLVQHLRPDIRTVVVRRPVEESVESLMRVDMRGVCSFNREVLTRELARMDRCLDRIEQAVPGVMSVRFSDLADEQVCAGVFEHCLPYGHDHEWWAAHDEINMQASMPALMRYFFTHHKQIIKAATSCRRQLRGLVDRKPTNGPPRSLDSVTIQQETFETIWSDGQALFAEHAAEVGGRDGVILNPNVALMENLERKGAVQIITARADGRLVGYLATLISPSLEDANLLTATQTVFFVTRDFRGIGPRLQRISLDRLRDRGVDEVILRAGVRGSGPKLRALYQRLGAEDYGELYTLMLKAA